MSAEGTAVILESESHPGTFSNASESFNMFNRLQLPGHAAVRIGNEPSGDAVDVANVEHLSDIESDG